MKKHRLPTHSAVAAALLRPPARARDEHLRREAKQVETVVRTRGSGAFVGESFSR